MIWKYSSELLKFSKNIGSATFFGSRKDLNTVAKAVKFAWKLAIFRMKKWKTTSRKEGVSFEKKRWNFLPSNSRDLQNSWKQSNCFCIFMANSQSTVHFYLHCSITVGLFWGSYTFKLNEFLYRFQRLQSRSHSYHYFIFIATYQL